MLSWSPSISIVGMRQCGKTTLSKQLGKTYVTLDEARFFREVENGNFHAIESGEAPVIIDEIQKAPPLFDQVKFWIDQNKRPGRFILTGSVRFSDRKGIRESLTGRTIPFELLPLTLSECHSKPNFDFFESFHRIKSMEKHLEQLQQRAWCSEKQIEQDLALGGMPGICFARSEELRTAQWAAHLETILERDLELVCKSKLRFQQKIELLSALAENNGTPVTHTSLARRVGSSSPTIKTLISAFESLYLIRKHGDAYYFEDHGLRTHLCSRQTKLQELLALLHSELLAQSMIAQRPKNCFAQWVSANAAEAQFVINSENHTMAISCSTVDGATEKSLKSLLAFKRKFQKPGQLTLVVIHRGTKGYISNNGTPCIPWSWVV
jgi:predicted AAA+ superfamily ATPase